MFPVVNRMFLMYCQSFRCSDKFCLTYLQDLLLEFLSFKVTDCLNVYDVVTFSQGDLFQLIHANLISNSNSYDIHTTILTQEHSHLASSQERISIGLRQTNVITSTNQNKGTSQGGSEYSLWRLLIRTTKLLKARSAQIAVASHLIG